MFARFTQLTRHLSGPLQNYAHRSTAAPAGIMTSDTGKKMIHTAACLIIGDEVLGGKVRCTHRNGWTHTDGADRGHKLRIYGEVLLLFRNGHETC